MLPATLTRFHIVSFITLIFCVTALLMEQFILLTVGIVIFLTLTGLGVSFPHLKFFGLFVCHGTPTQRHVALTFDDGPDANSTPALLDLLQELQTEVAFFGIGKNVASNAELAARIVREGHLLENHTYHHSYLTNFFTAARLKKELHQTQAIIQQTTGITPKYFRPPMGLSNPHIFRAARSLGLKLVGWSVRGFDTQTKNSEKVVARITKKLKPGMIILLHDGKISSEHLVTTVKMLLAHLHARGYQVVRLDKLLN